MISRLLFFFISGTLLKLVLDFPVTVNFFRRHFMIEVKPDDTIKQVREKIHVAEGIPVLQQIITFYDQELEDTQTVSFYGIKKDSIITLIWRVDGK